ncbi:MAG: S4 domain-containing protein, partial [Actinomycetota bacterium]
LTDKEVDSIEQELKDGKLHPADTKRRLGREIVTFYYGEQAAKGAEEVFDAKFKRHATIETKTLVAPEIMVPKHVFKDGKVWVVKLLRQVNFAKTNSEARRLIEQGAVKLNDNLIKSPDEDIKVKEGDLLQVGKRKIARLKPEY